ncbi:polyphosphate polymerase domain-containing protein [Desulforegula conservatrix]|uniref:polyphosphate polymerase domain-containing protein n=1 Tax=Desulforegula conservatrix TaxID=153026 RepID=UPI00040635A2|nr:polyphosphate polymerase domain-containing protein [Desulforegula conservatrix]
MKRLRQKVIPPLLERYELKYIIPYSLIDPISDFVSAYCSLDLYCLNSPKGFYRINSLYLDSPDWLFLRMQLDEMDNRIVMRVRSYGDSPRVPYFLEIKQKTGDVVRKYRSAVKDINWFRAYTEPGFYPREVTKDSSENISRDLFDRMVFTYNAEPKVLTQYARKAWISNVDDYARITFDVEQRFRPETDYRPVPGANQMVSCDHSLVFGNYPGCDVILEVKCYTSKVPMWIIDMIRRFGLQRTGFSKYQTGALELLGLHRYDPAFRKSIL